MSNNKVVVQGGVGFHWILLININGRLTMIKLSERTQDKRYNDWIKEQWKD